MLVHPHNRRAAYRCRCKILQAVVHVDLLSCVWSDLSHVFAVFSNSSSFLSSVCRHAGTVINRRCILGSSRVPALLKPVTCKV